MAQNRMHEEISTRLVKIDAEHPDPDVINEAGALLRAGELVAFPTETVYGLGADALNATAAAKIFQAKGRPATNPLIVHVPSADMARSLSSEWPIEAEALAGAFWPGPLSIVVPRSAQIPDIISAGKPTVALRVPANPVALALLRSAGVPVAAPSANRSEQISPTTAQHVLRSLGGRIQFILDGGAASGGIESTVVAITSEGPAILRPGLITPAQIEAVIGPVRRPGSTDHGTLSELASPGLMLRHYAPNAPLTLLPSHQVSERISDCLTGLPANTKLGCITFSFRPPEDARLFAITLPDTPQAYAAGLYAALHAMDAANVCAIYVENPPNAEEWLAIRDRLGRASANG